MDKNNKNDSENQENEQEGVFGDLEKMDFDFPKENEFDIIEEKHIIQIIMEAIPESIYKDISTLVKSYKTITDAQKKDLENKAELRKVQLENESAKIEATKEVELKKIEFDEKELQADLEFSKNHSKEQESVRSFLLKSDLISKVFSFISLISLLGILFVAVQYNIASKEVFVLLFGAITTILGMNSMNSMRAWMENKREDKKDKK